MKKLSFLFLPVIVAFMFAGMPLFSVAHATDDDLQGALDQLRQARQSYKEAKAQEENEKQQAARERNQARRQQADERRAAAQKIKDEHRKTVLLHLIDIQIRHLDRTKERVSRMPNIEDALKIQLNSEIDKNIQKLNDTKNKVQNAKTTEELKALTKEIHDFLKSYREVVEQIVGAIHASRATKAVAKAEDRAAAIKAKIAELKAAGKDTTELEADIDEAGEKIDDAQENMGRKAFREANEDLKGAYQKFRDIAQKAKGL